MAVSTDIVIIKTSGGADPEGSPFREGAETLAFAFAAIGVEARIVYNRISAGRPAIILGALDMPPELAARVPDSCIIYNLEQLAATDVPIPPQYHELMRRCRVWDYARRNIAVLAERGVRARLIPIGHRPEIMRIPDRAPQDQDIDVLFYGAVSDRRRVILDALGERGLETVALRHFYGPERDAFIARAKVVLNMHFYEHGTFEIVRASYLLSNRKAVVAERNPDTEIEPDMQDAAVFAPYDGLVDACAALVADDARRAEVAERGHRRMLQRDIGRFLKAVTADLRV